MLLPALCRYLTQLLSVFFPFLDAIPRNKLQDSWGLLLPALGKISKTLEGHLNQM